MEGPERNTSSYKLLPLAARDEVVRLVENYAAAGNPVTARHMMISGEHPVDDIIPLIHPLLVFAFAGCREDDLYP